ncbi:hypothetical protein [Rhizobium leguminosarum]|uniref:hypothetical protein n=1 Tax=Rhizobium leguminosarum TaxID=384 RepID=UPI0015DA5CFA|nr:hypothetical protein [Rhizobium leguminosarum]NZD50505.1 hypothetical protein [Rhizobium leguminosarum]
MDDLSDNDLPRTRAEAVEVGSKRYFTGEQCKHGHVASRFTSNRRCTACSMASWRDWADANPDHLRTYRQSQYAENKETILGKWSKWYAENRVDQLAKKAARYIDDRDENLAYAAEYRASNPDRTAAASKKWREENPEKVKEGWIKWYQENGKERDDKRRSTPRGKIDNAMSSGIYGAIKSLKAGRSWESFVDYTIDELITHLTRLFTIGMSLENYGEWHIDHKIPKAVFNYSSPDHIDFKRCWALTNLQPLWAAENIRKHARLEEPFQPSLALPA